MSRKATILTLLVIAGGFVVALVQAQESSRRPNRQSSTTATSPVRSSSLADRLKSLRNNSSLPSSNNSTPKSAPIIGSDRNLTPGGPSSQRPAVGEPQSASTLPRGSGLKEYSIDDDNKNRNASGNENLRSILQKGSQSRGGAFGDSGVPRVPQVPMQAQRIPQVPRVPSIPSRGANLKPAYESVLRSPRRIASNPRNDELRPASTPAGISMISQAPLLRLETSGPPAIVVGKQADYEVVVSNLGESDALGVTITVDLPSWIKIVSSQASLGSAQIEKGTEIDAEDNTGDGGRVAWRIDRLSGRSVAKMFLQLTPTGNRPFDLTVDWSYKPTSSLARIEVQQPELEMKIDGPREMSYGETKEFTITLSNPGTGSAENVVLSLDPLSRTQAQGESSPIGAIEAGRRREFQIKYTAREAGTTEIRASAIGDVNLHAEATIKVLVRRAQLQLSSSGPRLKYAGTVVSYRVRVANTGDAVAEDVVAQVNLPPGAKYVGGVENAEVTARGISWPIGMLSPENQRDYEIHCELNSSGDNRMQFGVSGAGDLTATDEVMTRVETIAELKMQVNDPKGPIPVGEEVVYEVRIINRGTKEARQVKLVTQFSEGIEPIAIEGWQGEIVPGQVVLRPITKIGAGEELTIKITARAEKAGNHVFRAEVKCSDPETRLANEGTTRFFGELESPVPAGTKAPRQLESQAAPALEINTRR